MKNLILIIVALFVFSSCKKSKAEIEFNNLQTDARIRMNDLPKIDFNDTVNFCKLK